MAILIISKEGCPRCDRLKVLLKDSTIAEKHSIQHSFYTNEELDNGERAKLKQQWPQARLFPFLIADGVFIDDPFDYLEKLV